MAPVKSKKKWAFVSYSHKDQALARWFTLELRRLKVPCFFDERGLQAGDPLDDRIHQEILAAEALIVILTPDAIVSDWVSQELKWADEYERLIIPFEIETVSENRLPDPVRGLLRIDASESLVKGLGKLLNRVPNYTGAFNSLGSHLSKVGATFGTIFELIGRVLDTVIAYRTEQLLPIMPELKHCFLWRGTISSKGDELDLLVLEPPRDMPAVVPEGFEYAQENDTRLWEYLGKLIDEFCDIAFGRKLSKKGSVKSLFKSLKSNLDSLDHCRAMNLLILRSVFTDKPPLSIDAELTILRGKVNSCDDPPPDHELAVLLANDAGIALPTISIVVISHFGNKALPLCIEALCRQNQLVKEIVLIEDGGPGTEIKPAIDTVFNHVVLADDGKRGRRAACRAIGTRIASGDIILYVDGDVLLSPIAVMCVQELWQSVGFDTSISVMLPVAQGLSAEKTNYESAMTIGKQEEAQLSLYSGRSVLRSWVESSTGGRASAGDLAWDDVRSRVWAISRADVLAAGNWDPSFVGYGEEEIDLALRLERTCSTLFRIIRREHCFGVHCAHPPDSDQDEKLISNAARLIRKHPDIRDRRLRFFEGLGLRRRIEDELTYD